jgi:hypothetical protein
MLVGMGDVAGVAQWLAAGGDPNAVHTEPLPSGGTGSWPLLVIAARLVDPQKARGMLQALLDAGGIVDSPDHNGFTALGHAMSLDRREAALLLITRGASPDIELNPRPITGWGMPILGLEAMRKLSMWQREELAEVSRRAAEHEASFRAAIPILVRWNGGA